MADQVWWSLATATFRHPRESFGLAYGDRDPRDLQAAWGRPVGLGRIPETPDPPFKFYSILDEGQTPVDLVDGSGRRLNQV